MPLIEINKQTWVIQGEANIGILTYEGRLVTHFLSAMHSSRQRFSNKQRILIPTCRNTDMQVGLMTLAMLK
jgi:hypothetical protein